MSESAVAFTDNMLLDNVTAADGSSPKREDALRSEFVLSLLVLNICRKNCLLFTGAKDYESVSRDLESCIFFVKKLLWGPMRPNIRNFCYHGP